MEAAFICALLHQGQEFDRGREQLDKVIKMAGGPQSEIAAGCQQEAEQLPGEKKPELALKDAWRPPLPCARPRPRFAKVPICRRPVVPGQQTEDKARGVYEQILAQSPKDPQLEMGALEQIAKIYEQKKESPKAVALYQEYLNKHPDSPIRAEALAHIGAMQKQLGQRPSRPKAMTPAKRRSTGSCQGGQGRREGAMAAGVGRPPIRSSNLAETSKTLNLFLNRTRPAVTGRWPRFAWRNSN